MGYVCGHEHALLDFRLSLPEEWARDEPRRQACHVPKEVRYQTRHAQCLEMLDAWGDQVPPSWVTGDDELGRPTRFRHHLRERGERYVLGVPCTTTMRDLEAPLPAYAGCGRRPKAPWQSVTAWRQSLSGDVWTHLTVRDGEKGPVEIEMVRRRVQTRIERKRSGPEEWLVVTRRPLADDPALRKAVTASRQRLSAVELLQETPQPSLAQAWEEAAEHAPPGPGCPHSGGRHGRQSRGPRCSASQPCGAVWSRACLQQRPGPSRPTAQHTRAGGLEIILLHKGRPPHQGDVDISTLGFLSIILYHQKDKRAVVGPRDREPRGQ
jgi:hypothetical protein